MMGGMMDGIQTPGADDMQDEIDNLQARLDRVEPAVDLLTEWYDWWKDSGPAKMPRALHIRTGLYFAGFEE